MSNPTDHEIDLSVASMLRFGVTLAAVVVLAGGLLYLRHPWSMTPDYTHFNSGGASRKSITGVFDGLVQLKPRSIIQFGLILLIATPVARVVICVIGFARQKDRLYVSISSVVLIILLYSLTKSMW